MNTRWSGRYGATHPLAPVAAERARQAMEEILDQVLLEERDTRFSRGTASATPIQQRLSS